MAERKPNSSRPSPSASERAPENSAGVQRPQEPLPDVAASESPSADRLLAGFPADHTVSVCWPASVASDTCVSGPLEDAADSFGEASSVLQLEAVRPAHCSEVIAPGQDAEDDSAMMDALGCRSCLPGQHQQFNVDRYGIAPHADSTYATLTPLQPLPPISAVSERLGSGVVLMQGGNGDPHRNTGHTAVHAYSPYNYQPMKEVKVCSSFQQQLPNNSHCRVASSAFAAAQQYVRYGQNLGTSQHAPICKSEFNDGKNPLQSEAAVLGSQSVYASDQLMSAMPGVTTMLHGVDGSRDLRGDLPSQCQVSRVDQQTALPCRASSPDQPSSSTDVRCDPEFISMSAALSACHHSNDKSLSGGEEISTRDVALRVSSELKRYSIPQAVFAQRILGRSQGTLSDLLRNPKPWSKLKSGRETFRRMWNWLQEPEYQRMAALRAGWLVFYYCI